MKTIAIYSIKNLKNGKVYIGSTTNFERRFYYHLYDLRKNKHYNIHLQRSYNKYNEDSFVYSLVEECKKDELIKKEEYYIEKYKACDYFFGYNINNKADRPPSWEGKKHKDETKIKISQANKGKKISDSHKKKVSETHKGKKISDLHKKILSEKNTGNNNPMFGRSFYDVWLEKYDKEEADKRLRKWKYNVSKSNKGKITSEETKIKISQANKGKKRTELIKEKIRKSKLGKSASEKTKKLMSEKRRGEKNPACKLKNDDIKDILLLIKNEMSVINISKKYDVSKVTIYNIKNGKRKPI